MQGLQIWVNLPHKNKKVKPWYQHIKKNDIPTIYEGNDVLLKVLVGTVKNISSAVQTYSGHSRKVQCWFIYCFLIQCPHRAARYYFHDER